MSHLETALINRKKLDSPKNPVVKETAKLRTSRGRQQTGKIIIDGEREISRAAAAGLEIDSLFLPEGAAFSLKDVGQVFEVSSRALAKIAFGKRLEPVAVATRPTTTLETIQVGEQQAGKRPLFVVLEAIEKPGNIGAVFRSADAAGVTAVILVDPLADPFNPNAIRASLGTAFATAVATATFDEYQTWASQYDIRSFVAVCDANAADYRQVAYDERPSAIVLGNEAGGLSNQWDKLENFEKIFLPMRGVADSLNVSAAATVLMYEATRNH